VNPDDALIAALKLLEKRDYLAEELREALERRGCDGAQITHALDCVERWGFIDDQRVARSVAERQSRRYGKERILAELEAKGASEQVRAAIEKRFTHTDQIAKAKTMLAVKKFTPDERAKAARFLAGRGFSEEVIESIIEADFKEPSEW